MNIKIRRLEPSDYEGMKELHECPSVFHNTLQLPLQSAEQWRGRVAQTSPDIYQFVATADGKLVGWVSLNANPHVRRRHSGRIILAVHENFQGKKIGASLLATAIDWADNWLNLQRLELSVYTDNNHAIKLYEKFGFALEGTHKNAAFRAGEFVDEHAMARIIAHK